MKLTKKFIRFIKYENTKKIIVVETIQMSMNERKLNAKWIIETNQSKLKRKRDGVEGIVID